MYAVCQLFFNMKLSLDLIFFFRRKILIVLKGNQLIAVFLHIPKNLLLVKRKLHRVLSALLRLFHQALRLFLDFKFFSVFFL